MMTHRLDFAPSPCDDYAMTNNQSRIMRDDNSISHLPLPADCDATAIMLNLIESALAEISSSLPYFRDRFDMISDYDDYIPAAARILTATTDRFLAHIDDTPRDALLALIADDDFILDMMTADFSTDLHALIDLEYAD